MIEGYVDILIPQQLSIARDTLVGVMIVVQSPHFGTNHYQTLFAEGALENGVETQFVSPMRLPVGLGLRRFDAVHLQWLDAFVDPRRSWFRRWFVKFRLLACLVSCRILRKPVVWTVHNDKPHSGKSTAFERWARLLARQSRAMVVHSAGAEDFALRLGPRGQVLRLPMGPYSASIPSADRTESRRSWGVDGDAALLVSFGQLRPQKGLADLFQALQHVAADDERLQVIVAGWSASGDDCSTDRAAAERDSRVTWVEGPLPEKDLGTLLAAADAVALPYKGGTTSSSAQLAAEFGLRILGPRSPMIEQYGVTDWLYEAGDTDGLRNAIVQLVAEGSAGIASPVKAYRPPGWAEIAATVIPFYRSPSSRCSTVRRR